MRQLGPHFYVAADALLLVGREVLLVQRKNEPFQGIWAVPGGFVELDEKIEDAAHRELYEETGVAGITLEQFGTYGDPGRDPRGRVVGVVFWSILNAKPDITAGDDAANCEWFSIDEPPEMAFDHAVILKDAQARLMKKS